MPAYPSFIGSSYAGQSPVSDQEDTVNWYEEPSESQGATSQASLLPTPGLQQFLMVSQVGGRAMYGLDRAFGVIGNTFYEFLANGTSLSWGTVATDGNPATICGNGQGGDQLFITSGDHGYCFDLLTNVLTTVLSSGATQGGFLYGYFVAFDITQGQVRMSDLFDGTTWDPTQFFAPSIPQDPWLAMLVNPYGQILLIGKWTGSFYYNAGTFPIPFAPDPSGLLEEGIASTFSIRQAGKSAAWLATNKNGGYQVVRATGFTPQPISTRALEYQISRYARVDDAIGESYEDQGHAFYILTFPTAKKTHVYDFTTGKWHRRMTWLAEQNAEDSWRPIFHCFAFNKHLVCDRTTGTVYVMDIAFPLDVDGRVIRRIRRAPAVQHERLRMFFPKFELLLESGLGTSTGAGSNPLVMMRKSDDYGQTWSSERQASAGKIGQYRMRVRFLNTGSARGRVFEVSVTDPIVGWRITDAYLQIKASSEAA